ncbi:MAG: hypothetical protein APF76_07365 [Desulfitibacter sp. BRH_c19]|nr:MAG: hypothetical protein APF76_07365 [Desulfitibacter sp. BRH_c19]
MGRKFVELIIEKKDIIMNDYNLEPLIVAAVGTKGGAIDKNGLVLQEILKTKEEYICTNLNKWRKGVSGLKAIEDTKPNVVLEAGPTNLDTGEPGLSHAIAALSQGIHFVTLSKGPIVCSYNKLHQLAKENNAYLKFSGATAAALPTIDVAMYCLAGTEISSIQGILNGTTNYILSQMTYNGITYEDALLKAQQKGIAESDPRLDIEGWDTAAKILILANTVMNAGLKINDLNVKGITDITLDEIYKAKNEGNVIKLVGEVVNTFSGVKVNIGPKLLPFNHPLAAVNGATKGVCFNTDTMGELTIIGGKSDPKSAAAAALKDILTIYRPTGKL